MKTPYETQQYKGITINIHQDEGPENPFEAWDCEPPLATYYGGRHGYFKAYQGAPETWGEILALLPDSCFERGKRVEFVKQFLNASLRECIEETKVWGGGYDTSSYALREVFSQFLSDQCGATPSGWSDAVEWFEAAEAILNWGGITAVYEQSTGYSQGDVTLCLAIATPAWVQMVGAPPETHKAQMESAIELYGQWAWGDVYGYTCEDENGEDVGHGCWGFYGSDHDKSGLLESAQSEIDCHLEAQAKEAESLTAAFSF
jgi:hypothetical protein